MLSAAISTKGGKTLVARQFQDIPKLRVEGLLAAFPKLIGGSGMFFVKKKKIFCKKKIIFVCLFVFLLFFLVFLLCYCVNIKISQN